MTDIIEPSQAATATRSPTIGKLAEALSKAQGSMKPASKGVANTFFKSKYADLPAVWEAARVPLSSNGLSVIQTTDHEGGEMFIVTTLAHSSGEWISGRYRVKPVKDDPQGIGSAISYARRYAFCSIVGVTADDEDDDGNAASGNPPQKKQPAREFNDRFATVKKAIETSNDPATTWHENREFIAEAKQKDQAFYDDLIAVAGKRKQQLQEAANVGTAA